MKNLYSTHTIICLFLLLFFAGKTRAQTYPAGFSQQLVTSGIAVPTVMAFAPDGRIFVCEQSGNVRIVKNGVLLSTAFVSINVDDAGERGVLGIAFDPDFTTNQYVYIYYTRPNSANNRISRFTANGDVAVAGSESVILELDPLTNNGFHNGGTLAFGPDGKLYAGVGENGVSSNAQDPDTYLGKILRINADGSVPSGNPFTGGTAQSQRVWAYGLRNPYTITFQPGTGRLFINDVGQGTWEEINEGTVSGLNYGWPGAEGNSADPDYTDPVYAYAHGGNSGQGCAITGGAFYNSPVPNYPASYNGVYFYMDFCNSWIDYINIAGATATRSAFASDLPGSVVGLTCGPDGNLYFLARTSGALYKIVYASTGIAEENLPSAGFSIYPLSPKNTIQLELNQLSAGQNLSLQIYSVDGKLVLDKAIRNDKVQQIAVGALSSGTYVAVLNRGTETLRTKFMITE